MSTVDDGTDRPALEAVTLVATDLAAALTFYDAVLGAIGLIRLADLVDEEEDDAETEAVGWGRPDTEPVLWLVTGSVATVGAHVRFAADSPDAVDEFHARALGTGGASRSAPRRWAIYRRGQYSAVVSDPSGNLVEAVSPE